MTESEPEKKEEVQYESEKQQKETEQPQAGEKEPVRYDFQPSTESQPVPKPPKSRRKIYVSVIIIAAIIAVIGFYFYLGLTPQFTGNILGVSQQTNENVYQPQTPGRPVMVGGVEVTQEEIDKVYNQIPEEFKAEVSKENITEALIKEKLLLKEAEKQGLNVTDEEIDTLIQSALAFSNQTVDEFIETLSGSGTTYEEFVTDYKKQLLISKLIEKNLNLSQAQVSEQEIDSYFEEHKAEYEDLLAENPEYEEILKERIRQILERDKQRQMVDDYIETII